MRKTNKNTRWMRKQPWNYSTKNKKLSNKFCHTLTMSLTIPSHLSTIIKVLSMIFCSMGFVARSQLDLSSWYWIFWGGRIIFFFIFLFIVYFFYKQNQKGFVLNFFDDKHRAWLHNHQKRIYFANKGVISRPIAKWGT